MRGGGGGAGQRGGGRPSHAHTGGEGDADPLQPRLFVRGASPERGGVGAGGEKAGPAGGAPEHDGAAVHFTALHPRGHHLLVLRGGRLVQAGPEQHLLPRGTAK